MEMPRWLLSMMSSLLMSCATVPNSQAPAEARPLHEYSWQRSFDAPVGEWPTRAWWSSFNDPQLDRLIVEAIANSPNLSRATALVREAQYRSRAAGSSLWPSLSASAAAQETKLTYNGVIPAEVVPHGYNSMGSASLDLSWELDFWGRNRKSLSAAVSQMKAAQVDTDAARLLLAVAVTRAYVRLQGLSVERAIAVDVLRNRQESNELVRRRVSEGLDDVSNQEQATARMRLGEALVAEVDESMRLTRHLLAALLGAGPDRGLDVETPALNVRRPVTLPADLKLELLARNPAIVAARWRAEAAAARVGIARTAFYPNVNLLAFIGYESLGIQSLTDDGSDVGGVGAAVHLPIFEGGRLRAQYGKAQAEYEVAVASYNEAVTQSLHEIADAIQSLQALKARTAATEQALAHATRAYELARMRYQGGLSDYQSVLTAEDSLLAVRNADNALHTRGYLLDIDLSRALGGGVLPDPAVQER